MKKLEKLLDETAILVSSGPVARAVAEFAEKNKDAEVPNMLRELVAAVASGVGMAARHDAENKERLLAFKMRLEEFGHREIK